MSKLLLLFTVFLTGILFMFIPDTIAPYDYFLLSDMKLHFGTYVYFICERLVLIILAYIIASEAVQYRSVVWVFFWLLVADLADFLIIYNEIWFTIGEFPVSMNICKVVIFGLIILRKWIRTLHR